MKHIGDAPAYEHVVLRKKYAAISDADPEDAIRRCMKILLKKPATVFIITSASDVIACRGESGGSRQPVIFMITERARIVR